MTPDAVDRAAKMLFNARRQGSQIEHLPVDCRPCNQGDAYSIQDRLLQMLEVDTVGWFLGGTSAESRRMLRMPEPYAARLIASTVCTSPVKLAGDAYLSRGIDVEFAFTLGTDLEHQDRPLTVESVVTGIDTFIPAIDIVNSHYLDWSNLDWPSVVADNGTDGTIVLGTPIKYRAGLDLRKVKTELTMDGRSVATGSGMAVLGDPLLALTWLANHVRVRGDFLRAGELIVTGSSTKIHFAPARASLVARFLEVGDVVVDFV